MGLLDSVIGSLMGGGASGGSSSPMGSVLTSLLGGMGGQGQGGQAQGGQVQGGQGAMAGGLGSLLGSFEQAGLGHLAQSWVSNGPNQPVSPDQLQSVFGEQRVQSMASQSGMAPGDFLSQLSQHLPQAVHGMTPDGRLPDEGSVEV